MTTYDGLMLKGLQIQIEANLTEIPAGREADPDWRYVDDAGHLHAYVESKKGRLKTPTLIEIPDEPYYCTVCDEEHEQSHFECQACYEARRGQGGGTHIEPGTRSVGPQMIQAGPPSIIAKVQVVDDHMRGHRRIALTEEQFENLLWAAHAEATRLADADPQIIIDQEFTFGP